MYQIVGYRDSKGEFTPNDGTNRKIEYDNWVFAFVTNENDKFTGLATEKDGMRAITIRKKDLKDLTGFDNPLDLVEKKVNLYYGMRYGKAVLTRVDIIK